MQIIEAKSQLIDNLVLDYFVENNNDVLTITVTLSDDHSLIGHVYASEAKISLSDKYGTMIVFEATLDKFYRKKGLGKLMYEKAIEIAAKHNHAVFPEKALGVGIGHTSTQANRVWKSLRKKYVNVGKGVVGILK